MLDIRAFLEGLQTYVSLNNPCIWAMKRLRFSCIILIRDNLTLNDRNHTMKVVYESGKHPAQRAHIRNCLFSQRCLVSMG